MTLDDLVGNIEPKAQAAEGIRLRFTCPEKAVEQLRLLAGRNANTKIIFYHYKKLLPAKTFAGSSFTHSRQ